MKKVKNFLTLRWAWFKNADNRRNLYTFMRFGMAPAVIAAGFVTPGEVDKWLLIISSVLLYGSTSVAHHNVTKNEEVAVNE